MSELIQVLLPCLYVSTSHYLLSSPISPHLCATLSLSLYQSHLLFVSISPSLCITLSISLCHTLLLSVPLSPLFATLSSLHHSLLLSVTLCYTLFLSLHHSLLLSVPLSPHLYATLFSLLIHYLHFPL